MSVYLYIVYSCIFMILTQTSSIRLSMVLRDRVLQPRLERQLAFFEVPCRRKFKEYTKSSLKNETNQSIQSSLSGLSVRQTRGTHLDHPCVHIGRIFHDKPASGEGISSEIPSALALGLWEGPRSRHIFIDMTGY